MEIFWITGVSLFILIGIFLIGYFVRQKRDSKEVLQKENKNINEELVAESEKPTVDIIPVAPSELSNLNCIDLQISDEQKHVFNEVISPIIQQLPNITMTTQHMNSYIATFSNQVTKGLADGTHKLVKDTVGRMLPTAQEGGKYVEHARLHSGFSPAILGLMVWQVLAVITAQKFLADINKRLAEIEKGVQEIHEWLKDEETSKVIANMEYIKQLYSCFYRTGSMQEINIYLQAFEDIEREYLQIIQHVKIRGAKKLNLIKNADIKEIKKEAIEKELNNDALVKSITLQTEQQNDFQC